MKRLLAASALTLLAGAALPMNDAYACSCVREPGSPEWPLEGTVFYGAITSRVTRGGETTYLVDVERVYAGEAAAKEEVTTSASGASCGLEIPGHGPTLFYAQREAGGLTASLCSGTRAADGPPENLGPGRAPTSASPTATTPVAAPPATDGREGGAVPYVTAVVLVGGVGTLLTRRLRQ